MSLIVYVVILLVVVVIVVYCASGTEHFGGVGAEGVPAEGEGVGVPAESPARPITVYFAGPLFNLQELFGNRQLAHSVQRRSGGRYKLILPQKTELQGHHANVKEIRDNDIRHVQDADMVMANINGADLDSGTVVEFMIAKFLDKPALLLRTDFRAMVCDGENVSYYNLMLSNYPRTIFLRIDTLGLLSKKRHNHDVILAQISDEIIRSLDELWLTPPVISGADAECVDRVAPKLLNVPPV